jgi:LysR family glycine cleavage system transcriptional activator
MGRRDLPPLHALRSFEAAARHLNLTRAAAELRVTHGAVSRQVKLLEEHVGLVLFQRNNTGVSMTAEGRALFLLVRESFERIAEGLEEIHARRQAKVVTATVLPAFAARWLIPRLATFQRRHPDIEVRFSTSVRLVDLHRESVDIGIRYGRGSWPSLRARKLLAEELFPVCSPRLIDGNPPLHAPEDLRRHVLLHNRNPEGWQVWLEAAGLSGMRTTDPIYDDYNVVLQAAIDGHGVALGRSALVDEDLRSGRLARPFDLAATPDLAYYIVTPLGAIERSEVGAFIGWLIAAAEQPGSAS